MFLFIKMYAENYYQSDGIISCLVYNDHNLYIHCRYIHSLASLTTPVNSES